MSEMEFFKLGTRSKKRGSTESHFNLFIVIFLSTIFCKSLACKKSILIKQSNRQKLPTCSVLKNYILNPSCIPFGPFENLVFSPKTQRNSIVLYRERGKGVGICLKRTFKLPVKRFPIRALDSASLISRRNRPFSSLFSIRARVQHEQVTQDTNLSLSDSGTDRFLVVTASTELHLP